VCHEGKGKKLGGGGKGHSMNKYGESHRRNRGSLKEKKDKSAPATVGGGLESTEGNRIEGGREKKGGREPPPEVSQAARNTVDPPFRKREKKGGDVEILKNGNCPSLITLCEGPGDRKHCFVVQARSRRLKEGVRPDHQGGGGVGAICMVCEGASSRPPINFWS